MFWLILFSLFACQTDDKEVTTATQPNLPIDTGSDDSFSISGPHANMFAKVKSYISRPELYSQGEWHDHWGDGAMFGPSFDLAYWMLSGHDNHLHRAQEALTHNRQLVTEASGNVADHLDNVELLSMSLLSLIEAGLYLDNNLEDIQAATDLLEPMDTLSKTFGDYLDVSFGEFAATSYGPTSLSAFNALIHLQYAMAYPDFDQEYHLQRAEEIMTAVHNKAYSQELSAYRFAPEDERLMLYPNITMMLCYARAYSMLENPLYLQRYETIYAGIQPLKDASGDHYHSPYSAESMGAEDEDYSTLSSQNYLILALIAGYQNTQNDDYMNEVETILLFIENKLMEGNLITHHWMNGKAASLDDPYYYCLGCNLQTLYILVLLEAEKLGLNPFMD